MKTTFSATAISPVLDSIRHAADALAAKFPGESGERQPVHTVYGGAHIFKSDSAAKLGTLARRALDEYAPNFVAFAQAIGLAGAERLPTEVRAIDKLSRALDAGAEAVKAIDEPAWRAYTIYRRVREKLQREPVEDFRVDFEDGFGIRPDAEEDATAETAAKEMAKGMAAGTLPPFIGIRIKPFNAELHARSVRTLDIFLSTLLSETNGELPANFVVTLPKITAPAHVNALADLFDIFEAEAKLTPGSLKLELMIETPQSIVAADGSVAFPSLVDAARGRCVAAHFGTYDFTAGLNITAAFQHMKHLTCDFAKLMMQVSLAGRGVWLSDGATNIMPVPAHRAGADGAPLSPDQVRENRESVHRAWRLHAEHVWHSLTNAYYQGWDLHPAQLPTRYAAVYGFFLDSLDAATDRLTNFIEKAAQATLVGDVFDDAATGQGLLNYFLRAMNCGAITEAEALATGVTLEEFRSRSFLKILENRKRR